MTKDSPQLRSKLDPTVAGQHLRDPKTEYPPHDESGRAVCRRYEMKRNCFWTSGCPVHHGEQVEISGCCGWQRAYEVHVYMSETAAWDWNRLYCRLHMPRDFSPLAGLAVSTPCGSLFV